MDHCIHEREANGCGSGKSQQLALLIREGVVNQRTLPFGTSEGGMGTDRSRGEGKSCATARTLCSPYALLTECCIPLGLGGTLVLAPVQDYPSSPVQRGYYCPTACTRQGEGCSVH